MEDEEFDDLDFGNLDALVPAGLSGMLDDLTPDLDALLHPLLDRVARREEEEVHDLEGLDRLVPQGASNPSTGSSDAVGRLQARLVPAVGDDHTLLKRVVNTSAISWVGWEMAIAGKSKEQLSASTRP